MNKLAILSVVAAVGAIIFMMNAPASHAELETKFNEFINQYGRNYYSANEYEFRLNVFAQNLKRAEQLNLENPDAEFGVTQFADMTESEFMVLLGDRSDLEVGQPVYEPSKGMPNKDEVDWTKVFEPIQNQGSCGSCWSFAATATFEAYWNMNNKKLIKGAEQYLVDCDTVYDSGCNGGLAVNAFNFLQNNFMVDDNNYKYTARQGTCKTVPSTDNIGKTKGGAYINTNENDMLSYLQTTGPIAVSVDASSWSLYKSGVMTSCTLNTNHAVVVVAYGTDDQSGAKYWKIRNSWGASWGEAGFIRIAYGTNTCNVTRRPVFPKF